LTPRTTSNYSLFGVFLVRAILASMSLALVAILVPVSADTSVGDEQARTAALEFGRSLVRADVSLLARILPNTGKVRLNLNLLGPEEGAYSRSQVEAVLEDFFRQGTVRTFDLLRLECADRRFALAHARATVIDRNGRPAEIGLDLTFQPEGDRWVLREIRESSS